MHAAPPASAAPAPTGRGRHRKTSTPTGHARPRQASRPRAGSRHPGLRRTGRLIEDLGSVVSVSALALLGIAAAVGTAELAPLAEEPTYSVTFSNH